MLPSINMVVRPSAYGVNRLRGKEAGSPSVIGVDESYRHTMMMDELAGNRTIYLKLHPFVCGM